MYSAMLEDFEMARAIGADFIFVRQWSEMVDFKEFIEVNRLLDPFIGKFVGAITQRI